MPSGTLIYDADCGFCTRSAKWLIRGSGDRLEIASWQQSDLAALGLTEEMVTERAYWVEAGRAVSGGETAIADSLIAKGSVWSLVGRVIKLPFVLPLARPVYRVVARNRHKMPGGTDACRVDNGAPEKDYRRLI